VFEIQGKQQAESIAIPSALTSTTLFQHKMRPGRNVFPCAEPKRQRFPSMRLSSIAWVGNHEPQTPALVGQRIPNTRSRRVPHPCASLSAWVGNHKPEPAAVPAYRIPNTRRRRVPHPCASLSAWVGNHEPETPALAGQRIPNTRSLTSPPASTPSGISARSVSAYHTGCFPFDCNALNADIASTTIPSTST
jgi:hypothetical protein